MQTLTQRLTGRTIVRARPLTEREALGICWYGAGWRHAVILELDDGSAVIPMQDPEGNGPGALTILSPEPGRTP